MWAPRKGESSPEIARRAMRRRTAAASWRGEERCERQGGVRREEAWREET